MDRKKVDILVISLSSPLLVGLYHDSKLIKEYKTEKKTSDILPVIFDKILTHHDIQALYFAKGPGSFMAIKVTYIFLKTLAITKSIPIFATDGFSFNKNSPIKALGKKYFIKKDKTISTEILNNLDIIKPFILPEVIYKNIFSTDVEPLYVLPAV